MNTLWTHLREALTRAAIASATNLLFLILAAMLATLLVSGFVSRLCLAALELDFLVPEHIPAGRSVPGKLYVRNSKWLMPSFSIRVEAIRHRNSPTLKSGVYFPLIAGGATLEATATSRPGSRSQFDARLSVGLESPENQGGCEILKCDA